MAEGSGSTSFTDGSDAYFDIVCTPRGEDNIREEAVKYCPECQEYLCKTCTGHHGRLKATRSHKLEASSTAKQSLRVTMTTKCRYHPYRNLEMYCEAHDKVYCTTCIAKDHRSCSGVIDADNIEVSPFIENEIQRLQTDMKNFQDRLKKIHQTTQKSIGSLEKQRRKIAEEIEEVERNLIKHIQKFKYEAMHNLEKVYLKVKNELESTASENDDTGKGIKRTRKKIQSLQKMDERQQFIQSKLIQNDLDDTWKQLTESEVNGRKKLCFTENPDLKTAIMTATSLGHVHTNTDKEQLVNNLYTVKSSKQICVYMTKDRKYSCITDICQLPDGTIILTDLNNENIKKLGMNYSIKDHCDLDAGPTGICCTGEKEVAVKMNNNKVHFISIGIAFTKLRQISIQGGHERGITYFGGELWTSIGEEVNVYSTSGSLLKTVRNDIRLPQRMAVSGEIIIVADYKGDAVCLGRDGTFIENIHDDSLYSTTGICVSSDGTIFLSGFGTHNIVIFDKNKKRIRELEGKDYGMVEPVALCYDDRKKCLIVAFNLSSNILIFSF